MMEETAVMMTVIKMMTASGGKVPNVQTVNPPEYRSVRRIRDHQHPPFHPVMQTHGHTHTHCISQKRQCNARAQSQTTLIETL